MVPRSIARTAHSVFVISLLVMVSFSTIAHPKVAASSAGSWLTFLGSVYGDSGNAIVVDDEGNAYVTGGGYEWPETPVRGFSGAEDAYIVKLAANGALLWLTYLGGTGWDRGDGIAIDDDGSIFVTGYSSSSWAETPLRSHSGDAEAFVAKVDSAGALQWHTFLGGIGWDHGTSVALDGYGNVYVTGYSDSDAPSSPAPEHSRESSDVTWGVDAVRAHTGGRDAFVARLDATGSLIWHTFLGGSDDDMGEDIAVDDYGNAFVAGSGDSEWTESPIRAHSGNVDAFVAKVDASNGTLAWHTFLGGDGEDRGEGIAHDGEGSVFAAGLSATDWGVNPVRAYSGNYDVFAVKLDASTGALTWHTFVGGSSSESGYDIGLDSFGNVYVAGFGWATWGEPEQPFAGYTDGILAKLDTTGELSWHTFVGSTQDDSCQAIAIGTDGALYAVGNSNGTWDGPTRGFTGGTEAFAIHLSFPQSIELDLEAGWNMVSVPVVPADTSRAAVFPPADVVAVYTWNPVTKSYEVPTNIAPEVGYWVAVTGDKTITVTGTPATSWEDHPLIAGWNMVGSVYGNSVAAGDLDDDPSGSILDGAIYWWNPGSKSYVGASQIDEGLGYWMATTENCTLTMQPSA